MTSADRIIGACFEILAGYDFEKSIVVLKMDVAVAVKMKAFVFNLRTSQMERVFTVVPSSISSARMSDQELLAWNKGLNP